MGLRRRRTAETKQGDADVDPALDDVIISNHFVDNAKSEGSHAFGGVVVAQDTRQIDTVTIKYSVAKWLILRLMALIYLIAFLGAHYQNEGLIGSNGLQPAEEAFDRVKAKYMTVDQGTYDYDGAWNGFLQHPTIFWFIPLSDETMQCVVYLGLVLSTLALIGVNSWLIQLSLWLLDFSIVTVAGLASSFYSYGWESQVLETGFLCIFLCPLPHLRQGFPCLALWETSFSRRRQESASPLILWLFSWLSFRISMGAGLIKIRGSSCWRDKTCLHYHFETQPIPSPLSFFYHFLSPETQSRGVDLDLFVQLYTSWFVLVVPVAALFARVSRNPFPLLATTFYWIARVGGFVQAGFMLAIAFSGNFSFLNHLTVIPAIACIDDKCWPRFLVLLAGGSSSTTATATTRSILLQRVPNPDKSSKGEREPRQKEEIPKRAVKSGWLLSRRTLVDTPLLLCILYLSWPVIANLLQIDGSRQAMNASFGAFRLVNTYGAFGSVGKARYEPLVQISDGPLEDDKSWVELEFPCKPGNVTRRPCFCAPYHYRVDWNIWFLGFKPHKSMLQRRETWVYELLLKVVQKDDQETRRPWLALLDSSTARYLEEKYYRHNRAPRYIKVDMYRYQMAAPLWTILLDLYASYDDTGEHRPSVKWWKRRFEESLIPPLMLSANGKQLQYGKSSSHQ